MARSHSLTALALYECWEVKMHRIGRAFACVLSGALALGGVYVATSWSLHARLETAVRGVSRRAAKQDRLRVLRVAPANAAPMRLERHERVPDGGQATS